jgi:hypothetical protein
MMISEEISATFRIAYYDMTLSTPSLVASYNTGSTDVYDESFYSSGISHAAFYDRTVN